MRSLTDSDFNPHPATLIALAGVDAAGEPLNVLAGVAADHSRTGIAFNECFDKSGFTSAGLVIDLVKGEVLFFELPVDPGDKEEVAGAGLNGTGTGEEFVGEGVTDTADAEFITRIVFIEQVDDCECFTPFTIGVIEPGELGGHTCTWSFERGCRWGEGRCGSSPPVAIYYSGGRGGDVGRERCRGGFGDGQDGKRRNGEKTGERS